MDRAPVVMRRPREYCFAEGGADLARAQAVPKEGFERRLVEEREQHHRKIARRQPPEQRLPLGPVHMPHACFKQNALLRGSPIDMLLPAGKHGSPHLHAAAVPPTPQGRC